MNQKKRSPERYRFEIWEGKDWAWPARHMVSHGRIPQTGDTAVFFYAPSSGTDAGFYGWAVVLEWLKTSDTQLRFRPVAPSNNLKMHPYWDNSASALADKIRGRVKRGTVWLFPDGAIKDLRSGIVSWLAGRTNADFTQKK